MKTVEVDYQLEKVLNRLAERDNSGLNLMERMEIAIFVEHLRNTPAELTRPDYRVKHIEILGN